jgi:hypothetical protein
MSGAAALLAYRDDGPLAGALGRALGAVVRLPAPVLVVLGALPLGALAAAPGEEADRLAVAGALAWFVLLAGAAGGRPHGGRLGWLVPCLLRLAEYGTLLWFATLAGSSAVPAAYALLAALAFRHYDIVYRLRYQGVAPPPWLGLLAAGWEGRLLLAFAFLVLSLLPTAFFAAAALLGVVFAVESAAGWLRFERAERPAVYADDEDELG